MDQFSYLSVLLSLIVGLAITQILKGFRGIVLSRTRVLVYWPTLAWAALLLLMNVQSWWAMFGLRAVQVWTFAGFLVVLSQTIVQYMLAAIVFPDFFGDETIDLRAHYWAHTRWFFGLLILVLLNSLAKDLVLAGHFSDLSNFLFHACFLSATASAMLTRAETYHKLLPVLATVIFGAYIVMLFARLH
ncbi:hypothetical protein ELE36_18575 [Pseudolysobacter antarcticus]|uniref:Uncharacterized protein n=1 Tax=Pseudolysobacter antarcticus TaxID=2511995 RepID=A0A411HNY3_9GAMM|nr:hypothetical protein [Pseudolysobacter antarcticus]QBB72209.1 hypothetical protein ELE36_18575 [Pseudolysobacter antarcticus]